MALLTNGVFADVVSLNEVLLSEGDPYIQEDCCPYRNRRNTEMWSRGREGQAKTEVGTGVRLP